MYAEDRPPPRYVEVVLHNTIGKSNHASFEHFDLCSFYCKSWPCFGLMYAEDRPPPRYYMLKLFCVMPWGIELYIIRTF
ncbi:hypothetical protein CEXT_607641 [Caerostris extrusa]|uniref:Uncharacterized protein n=1 Tax=Caerostris extrusa TaxID=172846 RepID=A0AAV4NDN1_CAEEX|nr:hypothetical protein CEXT_607641 [Caerostris extrusa]